MEKTAFQSCPLKLISIIVLVGNSSTYPYSNENQILAHLMSHRNSTISVVIPCYNAEKFIRGTINSAVNQTYPLLEIIVIDDGSTDNSAAIAESFSPLVRVIRQKNQGESIARNRGIEEAKGDWIAFLDADDYWVPDKLDQQSRFFESDALAISSGYYIFEDNPTSILSTNIQPPSSYTAEYILQSGSPCQISGVLVKREIHVRFPEWTQYAEDAIYFLDLMDIGSFATVQEPLVGYRRHSGNQSNRADIRFKWHHSFQEWITRHPKDSIIGKNLAKWRLLAADPLVKACERSYWKRTWPEYWAIRNHLEKYDWCRSYYPFLTKRIYPKWLYSIKDSIW